MPFLCSCLCVYVIFICMPKRIFVVFFIVIPLCSVKGLKNPFFVHVIIKSLIVRERKAIIKLYGAFY